MKRVIYSFYIDIPKHELDIFDKELPIVKNKKGYAYKFSNQR